MKHVLPPIDCPHGDECTQVAYDVGAWHLDKRISIVHLGATFMAFVSFVGFAVKLEARIVVMEQAIIQVNKENSSFKDELKAIHNKLDRLIERQYGNGKD